MGFYFAFLSIPYFFSALLVSIFFENVPRKLQFILCFLLSTIAIMLMGPSEILGFPNHRIFILIGLLIMGLVQALVFVPTLPEAVVVLQQKYKIVESSNVELDNKLNDVLGSILSFVYNLSGLVGPIIGGYMYDTLSKNDNIAYRKTMDINMFFELGMAVIFMLFNCGLLVYKQSQDQQAEIEKMSEITEKLA